MTALILTFAGLAAIVAGAGVILARSADTIADITRLGRLLVGSLLLAAATSLPELTVDLAAVRQGQPDLAVGDLLGSSLMNLLILAAVDLVQRSGRPMLSREAASHALSATLGIALTAIAGAALLTADRLPHFSWLGIGGWSWSLLAAYVLGSRMIFIDQRISARAAVEETAVEGRQQAESWRWKELMPAAGSFAAAAAVLFLAGPRLAHMAAELADRSGLGGTFVGTTLVALTTSLPELVATITAVRCGAVDLAIGNTFGSNAFNMILFAPLDAAHPGSLFSAAAPVHAVTALAVITATAVAVLGQLYRVERRLPLFEPDAWLVLLIVFGALGLVYRLS
jgi:cation:H+ antiporter